jgi:hypothetical protein
VINDSRFTICRITTKALRLLSVTKDFFVYLSVLSVLVVNLVNGNR